MLIFIRQNIDIRIKDTAILCFIHTFNVFPNIAHVLCFLQKLCVKYYDGNHTRVTSF